MRASCARTQREGFAGELLAASSAGGVVPIGELIDSPLWSVRSGPSLAPVAARALAAAETGSGDAIVCDTGGTSFDVSLVRAGDLVFTGETARVARRRERCLSTRLARHVERIYINKNQTVDIQKRLRCLGSDAQSTRARYRCPKAS